VGSSAKGCFADDFGLPEAGLPLLGCTPDAGSGRWYALYVRSRHEKVVEGGLKGKGLRGFLAVLSHEAQESRPDRLRRCALFPGYVFCLFDSNKRLPILTTPGIVGIVGPGNRPDDSEIASIRTLALSGRPVQQWPFLRSGQRVRLQASEMEVQRSMRRTFPSNTLSLNLTCESQ
jgi:transcription antitermination factor NusG